MHLTQPTLNGHFNKRLLQCNVRISRKIRPIFPRAILVNFKVGCLHFELLCFLKYDVLFEYLTPFRFATHLTRTRDYVQKKKFWQLFRGRCHGQKRCTERTWPPLQIK